MRALRVVLSALLVVGCLWWGVGVQQLILALFGLLAGVLIGLWIPIRRPTVRRQHGLGLAFATVAGPLLARWIAGTFGEQTLVAILLVGLGAFAALAFVVAWRLPPGTATAAESHT